MLGWDKPVAADLAVAGQDLRIAAMDAWVWIPFMMILLLAGLQALPKEVQEAAKVDGATGWQGFWQITFPLMLPVSVTDHRPAHHLPAEARRHRHQHHIGRARRRHRHGLELHLPRIPDRSNVGYGTMIAEVYLIIIIIFVDAAALKCTSRCTCRGDTERR